MTTITKDNLDSVFHAYDIRGRDPEQLDNEFFTTLGKAFATYLNAKKVAVGHDFRKTSKQYHEAFIKGVISTGCDVVDIGEIATEITYFSTLHIPDIDGSATITASHNPKGWNGCKMVAKQATPLSGDKGLPEVKELMLKNDFHQADKSGEVTEQDIKPAYKEKILSILKGTKIKPMKIIVDAGNGIGGKFFDYIFSDLPLEVVKMYFEPDDNFPHHTPNPIELENVEELMKKTVELEAEIGMSIDGDADRVGFIDNKGRNPDGVYTGAILAKYYMDQNKGTKIVFGPNAIFPIRDEVKKAGSVPIVCKTGHSFFKAKMKEEDAVFGLEQSSHYYYKDFYYADSGMTTIAIMIKLLSEGLDFDEQLDYFYANYPMSGEVNYQVEDPQGIMAEIEKHCTNSYQNLKIDHLDGVSIEHEEWRFNLRPSNTQPLIRLNVEGKSKDIVIEKFREFEELIGGVRDNKPVLKELQ